MQTGGKILAAGLVIGGAFPAMALFAIGINEYFGCNTRRAEACLDLGWLGILGKSALGISFMIVLLGLVVCALGLIWLVVGLLTRGRRQEGVHDGTPLPLAGASSMQRQPEEPAAALWRRPRSLVGLVFDWILGAAAMAIFASAAVLPTSHGRLLARGNAMAWQIAAALGIVITLAFIIRRRRYAPLLLLAAALFFFTSGL